MLVEVIRGEGKEKPLSLDPTDDEDGCFLNEELECKREEGKKQGEG